MASRVCVVGLGYVGLTLAVHAARRGYEVFGLEKNLETLSTLVTGKSHFREPGLDALLSAVLGKNLFISEDLPADISCDFFIVTVGTPLTPGVSEPALDYIDGAVATVSRHARNGALIILRSTVPVGTTRLVAERVRERSSVGESLGFAFCPERTAEGSALSELSNLPQVISGLTESDLNAADRFFNPLCNETIKAASLEEAELTKLFNNTYRDAVFAISNTFNLIAQQHGLDGVSVINNANYKYPRSSIPKPGFVAGPCLEKDAHILAFGLPDGHEKEFIKNIRISNENLEAKVANFLTSTLKNDPEIKILVSGLAFKGVPETNDLRGSSSIKILSSLAEFHDRVIVHDFMNSRQVLESTTPFSAIGPDALSSELSKGYGALVILNNHSRYTDHELISNVKRFHGDGGLVFDSWSVMNEVNFLTIGTFLNSESRGIDGK